MSTIDSISSESCRLCQQEIGVVSLENNLSLQQKIFMVTKIKVKCDLFEFMPQRICESCCKLLDNVDIYRKRVQKVDKNLKLLVQKQRFSSTPNISNSQSDKLRNGWNRDNFPGSSDGEPAVHKQLKSPVIEDFCCPVCQKSYLRGAYFELHKKTHKELFCAKCNKTFNCESQTKEHICVKQQIVTDENCKTKSGCDEQTAKDDCSDCRCEVCNVKFDNKASLEKHMKQHKEKREFMCSEDGCSKVFPAFYLLKAHRLRHEGERPFLCVTCGKAFHTKSYLNCHEKIHLGTKSYRCDWCDLNFSVRSNLRAHLRAYHEGVRYYCSQCTKAFVTKCTLERHEKTHVGIKDFKCQECTSEFYTKKELMKHQRYHQGLKPFQCDQCLKRFFENHHLTIHLRIHSGERPYVCDFYKCGKTFIDKQKLKRHQKSKHKLLHDSEKHE